ncbi:CPBP family intramembrane metalloprotease [Puniceicoccales bacterium CK1056]|uniref:CPBP family intramembrane metalloprotease n=1 Tax=Oceanipulchritudo coccoides TaxID=2706888 RepID=A0A6B2M376_9BACT|nr:CPBP family intramembrane glutamic endopeptidase [Oceanipulchritudo coccoides]NDV63461.1 CPBP family intramembrane metalloprotease [Oceanipulchritudo coccoides]
MTPEEIEAWLLEQPFVLAYMILLLLGSLVSFIVLILKVGRARRIGTHTVSPWPLKTSDFALFMVTLTLWFVLSGAMLMQFYSWMSGEGSEPGTGMMVMGGILLQAGMLYVFLRFRFHFRSANEGPISPKIISLGQSLFLGLFYFLASLPVVYGVGVAWNGLLEYLRQQGFDINLPLQDAVVLFQEASSPIVFVGLILLAVVVAPVVEETVFRAGIYRFFKGKTSVALSLLISGTLFGLVHGNVQSLPGLVAVGVCLGFAYELSGSIRVPIFFHAFFNLNSIIWILLLPANVTG